MSSMEKSQQSRPNGHMTQMIYAVMMKMLWKLFLPYVLV